MPSFLTSILNRVLASATVAELERLAVAQIHNLLLHEEPAIAAITDKLTPDVLAAKLTEGATALAGYLPERVHVHVGPVARDIPVHAILTSDVLALLIQYVVFSSADQLKAAEAKMKDLYTQATAVTASPK